MNLPAGVFKSNERAVRDMLSPLQSSWSSHNASTGEASRDDPTNDSRGDQRKWLPAKCQQEMGSELTSTLILQRTIKRFKRPGQPTIPRVLSFLSPLAPGMGRRGPWERGWGREMICLSILPVNFCPTLENLIKAYKNSNSRSFYPSVRKEKLYIFLR